MGTSVKMVRKTRQNQYDSEGSEEPDYRNLIAAQVGEVFHELLPSIVDQMKEDLEQIMVAKITAAMSGAGSSNQTRPNIYSYKDFSACKPPTFEGKKDPLVSTRWISAVEGAFRTSFCPAEAKVRCATNLLRGSAKNWWELLTKLKTEPEIEAMTWEEFKTLFLEHFAPPIEIERVTREFLSLEQTTESVNEITEKFLEKALFCPEYVASEKMKMSRYSSMLRTDIREFVVTARCQTLNQMVEVARTRELELENQARKRKLTQQQTSDQFGKKLKPNGAKNEQESKRCEKCGGRHRGECKCFKCGKVGHKSTDCKETTRLCYNCHQPGHIKPNCPLLTGQTIQAVAPATLRITDGATGSKAEAPKARGRAFQLITVKDETEPEDTAV